MLLGPNGSLKIIVILLISIPPAASIKCFFLSKWARTMNVTQQEVDCECNYCAKTVSKVEDGLEIVENWCGCKAEFTCRSEGKYRYNSIFDEYAIAHCCSTDLCNSSPTSSITKVALLSLLLLILRV
ncbi:unnamed protein product, partial [Mesorhabditis spiculigera]